MPERVLCRYDESERSRAAMVAAADPVLIAPER